MWILETWLKWHLGASFVIIYKERNGWACVAFIGQRSHVVRDPSLITAVFKAGAL